MAVAEPAVNPALEQRLNALERANFIRSWRADAKKEMTARRAMALIDDPPWIAETWKLGDLLRSVPKWGKVKARNASVRVGVSLDAQLVRLTRRQRDQLIRMLDR